jgi:threonine dehydratase
VTRASTAIRDAPPLGVEVGPAAAWLARRVVRTPVIRAAGVDRLAGARLWLKAENLQHTGSYKFRGALRAVGRLSAAASHSGVIAQSTGNHALAVALAARTYGLDAVVVLPEDAAPIKVAKARALGARIVLAGTSVAERLEVVEELRRSTGHPVIDAYDHPDVVAGQGTATRELVEQVRGEGGRLDAVVVPVGGGGGVAGACVAVRELSPNGEPIAVHGVEPVGCDALARSLRAGERVTVEPAATLADGLRPSTIGRIPFEIARESIAGVTTVSDAMIGEALCLALFEAKLLVEPSAAAALAGALRLAATGPYSDIGVILTGGNVDPALVARLVGEHAPARSAITGPAE